MKRSYIQTRDANNEFLVSQMAATTKIRRSIRDGMPRLYRVHTYNPRRV